MQLMWSDVQEIALELLENQPKIDPLSINFVDLHKWITSLPNFIDNPNQGGGEKVLEAIQSIWIEEFHDK